MTFLMGPSLLFCPADRPERYAKAAERADAVIIDLEDAVAPADKVTAREAMIDTPLDPERTVVRVNPVDTNDFDRDLKALTRTDYGTVMLAKTESVQHMRQLPAYDVLALCETAAGVVHAADIAAEPNAVALMWGAEDLVASLGGTGSRHDDGRYRSVASHARSSVLLAAGAYGKAAIDAVYINIGDLDGLAAEAQDAVASGFAATACIHPSQVPVIREAFLPTEDEVAYAREVLEAAKTEGGVFEFRGRMVDGPLLRHAEQTLRRAAG
ncbi:HpcH/HpaI aldolase/citrate lyase family protein [Arthrobacter castelli]|uniref:HpcH/HpaI aldolase/citrate lyase family protein n=1 Tax=Arthrobacter castelli TaxID=271431 RepID=UPI0004247BD0|nr:CoA ester lyase [Arthrobacter castelli]